MKERKKLKREFSVQVPEKDHHKFFTEESASSVTEGSVAQKEKLERKKTKQKQIVDGNG